MEIKVVKQILEWNEDCSNEIKKDLKEKKVCLINVLGSPGAGKTSLIMKLIEKLREEYRIGVIEGDIAGQIDAEKIDRLGCAAADGRSLPYRGHVHPAHSSHVSAGGSGCSVRGKHR